MPRPIQVMRIVLLATILSVAGAFKLAAKQPDPRDPFTTLAGRNRETSRD
jgi:hypothetical protein